MQSEEVQGFSRLILATLTAWNEVYVRMRESGVLHIGSEFGGSRKNGCPHSLMPACLAKMNEISIYGVFFLCVFYHIPISSHSNNGGKVLFDQSQSPSSSSTSGGRVLDPSACSFLELERVPAFL